MLLLKCLFVFAPVVVNANDINIKDACELSTCEVLEIIEKTVFHTDPPDEEIQSLTGMLHSERIDFRLRMLERRLQSMEQTVWTISWQRDRWKKCSQGECRCDQEAKIVSCWSADLAMLPDSQIIPYDVLQLDLGVNVLSTLHKDALRGLTLLEEFDLFDNKVDYLPATIFETQRTLKNLRLQRNNLETLHENLFKCLNNLRMIDFSYNHLHTMPAYFFVNSPFIESIDISNNKIAFIPNELFAGALSLSQIDLSRNFITKLETLTFQNVKSLKRIKLSENSISSLPNDVFEHLENLEILILRKNKLTSLPRALLKNQINLNVLDLSINKLSEFVGDEFEYLCNMKQLNLEKNFIINIPDNLFQNTSNLETLNLAGNRIEYLNMTAFQNLKNLKVLILTHNHLKEVHFKTFSFLSKVSKLHLDRNQFPSLPSRSLDYLPSLTSIKLAGNPWNCDCHALYISAWIRLNHDKVWDYEPVCVSPWVVEGRPLIDLRFPDLCTGQWASMVNLSPRLPVHQLLALNITVNRKPQQRAEDSYK